MGNNNVTTRKKTKKLIILLAAFFVLCGAGLGGVLAWKNWKEQVVAEQSELEKESDDKVVNGALVLDEEGMPEDGSDITDIKKASDSKTLRELLKSAGKFAIELTEDVRIEEELIVNGTKKLIGNKSIVMELYSEPFQSVLSVKKGATLILDGVTVDGSGIASGVTVEKGAGFTGLSGRVLYPAPYGITVAGIAKVSGINIEKSIDIGLCAQEGSTVQLNGGKIIDSNQTNVHIQATANVTISGNPLIDGSRYGVRNRGTCVMTGGTICDVSGYFVYNTGEFTVDYQGRNADDMLEWSGADGEAGIRTGVGSSTYIRGLHIRDCKQKGIAVVNHDDVVVENCIIENTGNFGFSTYNGKKEAILKNVQVIDAKASAVRASKTVKVSITDLTVKNATGFGIKNENALVVINNIVVENSGSTGIWGSLGSETRVNGATIVKPGKHGVENNSGRMTLKNVTVTDPQRTGYVGKKESVTDITNLTIKNATNWGIYNLGGNVTARDVTVLSAGTYGVATAKSGGFTGFIKVTNLTVDGVKEKDAVNCYESVLEVTNAKLSGAKRHGAIASKNGQMLLKDVDISDCEQRGVMGSGGVVTLKHVNITKCGKYGVTTAKTKEYTGSLTAEDLTITDITGNGLNNNGSVMTITRANISDITSNGAYAEKGSELTLTDVEFLNCAKRGLYVNSAGTKATFTDVKVRDAKQTSLFQGVGTKVTAKKLYLEDSGTYGIFVQSATFDAQNVTITGTGNNGLHIDSSNKNGQSVVNVDGLTVKKAGKRGVANTGGKVSLANVTITKPGTFGATTSKTGDYKGELAITNLTIKSVNGVKDNNALNCNGSVLKVTKGSIFEVAGNGAYVENGGQLTFTDMDIEDCKKRGVYVYDEGTKAVITDTTFTDSSQSTVFLGTGTELTAKNITVESPGSYGVYVQSAKMYAENVKITDSVENSLNISNADGGNQSDVEIHALTVTDSGDRGVFNEGGKVILTDVTITNSATYGATSTKADACVGELNITNLTITGGNNNALNCNGSVLKVTKGKISEVAGNGAYVEKGAQLTLTDVEIAGCGKRGIYTNGASVKATLNNVKIADTVMQNVRVKDAQLDATDLVVVMNDQIGQIAGEEGFYGICMLGDASNVTISGEKSTVTRTAAADVTPEKSAIWVEKGTLTINNGVYSGLRAQQGGVMFNNGGNIIINNGTFANNQASSGGALYNAGGTVTITGGTYKENSAGRGGVLFIETSAQPTTIDGATFSDNTASISGSTGYGGCVYTHNNSNAQLTVKDTVFQDNIGVGGAVCLYDGSLKVIGGSYTNNKSNSGVLEDIRGNSDATVTFSGQVNLYVGLNNTSKMFVNEALHADSKVYFRTVNNWLTSSTKTRDVIEFAEGLMPDASQTIFELYEGQASKYAMVFASNKLTLTDIVAMIGDSSYASLADAIEAANALDSATIVLKANVTVDATQTITGHVTITDDGTARKLTRGTTCTARVFDVQEGASLTIVGTGSGTITVDGNKVTATDSMVVNAGTFTLGANASLTNAAYPGSSSNETKGGALYNTGTATLAGTISGNEAFYGGALYNAGGTVSITGGTYETNSAGRGGVLYIETSAQPTTIDGATFSDNTASISGSTGYGGCVFMAANSNAQLTVKDTEFLDNIGVGGAICVNGGSVKVIGGNYENNKSNSGVKEDVRVNNAATATFSGQVSLYVGLNNTSKMLVNEALHADSKVYFRTVNNWLTSSTKTRDVIEFAEGLMPDASQTIFELYDNQASKYAMTFANNKLTLSQK